MWPRQTVSFYQNSSVLLDRLDSRSWDQNLADFNANPRFYHSATRKPATIVGYLMPNLVFTHILNLWFVNILCKYTVKYSNSSISNNSIKNNSTKLNASKHCYVSLTIQLNIRHLSTQSYDQTVLFQTIQFSISHLFALSLNVKQFYLCYR